MQVMAALRKGQPVTETAICRELSMSRQTVWEWRQDADFRVLLRTDLDNDQTRALRDAISLHLERAIQGSTHSLHVLAKLKVLGIF